LAITGEFTVLRQYLLMNKRLVVMMKCLIVMMSLTTFLMSSVQAATYSSDNEVFALFKNKTNGEKEFRGLCGKNSAGCLMKMDGQVLVKNNQLVAINGGKKIVIDENPTKLESLRIYYHDETYLVKLNNYQANFKSKMTTSFLPIHASMYEEDKYFCTPIPPGVIVLVAISQTFSNWKKVRRLEHVLTFTSKNTEIKLSGSTKKHGNFYYNFTPLKELSINRL